MLEELVNFSQVKLTIDIGLISAFGNIFWGIRSTNYGLNQGVYMLYLYLRWNVEFFIENSSK
jgi:hypothetical protein